MKNKSIPRAIKPKPYKGFVFLKSIPIGKEFITPSGMKGTVLSKNIGSVLCRFTDVTGCCDKEDESYYLGNRRIAPETNVKQIKEKNDARRV